MNRGLAAFLLIVSATALAGSVTPAEVARQIRDPQAAPFVLDVRTAGEFAEGHVPGAVNVPVQELSGRLAEVPKDRPVVVYCHSGGRAVLAANQLRERGYDNVRQMQGSFAAWTTAQLPVEK